MKKPGVYLYDEMSRDFESRRKSIEGAKQVLGVEQARAMQATHSLQSQIVAAKRVQQAMARIEFMEQAITPLPLRAADAVKLKSEDRVVVHWFGKINVLSAPAKILSGDGKSRLHLWVWNVSSSASGLMLSLKQGRLLDNGGIEYAIRTPQKVELSHLEAEEKARPLGFTVTDYVRVEYPRTAEERYFYGSVVGLEKTLKVRVAYYSTGKRKVVHDVFELEPIKKVWRDPVAEMDVRVRRISKEDFDAWLKTDIEAGSVSAMKRHKKAQTTQAMAELQERLLNRNGAVRIHRRNGMWASALMAAGKKVVRTRVRQPVNKDPLVRVTSRIVPAAIQEAARDYSNDMATLARRGAALRQQREAL